MWWQVTSNCLDYITHCYFKLGKKAYPGMHSRMTYFPNNGSRNGALRGHGSTLR